MISLHYLLSMLTLTVILVGLLLSSIAHKNLIRCLIFVAFFGGILLIELATAPVSKAYYKEIVKELKIVQTKICDPDDDGCKTEK